MQRLTMESNFRFEFEPEHCRHRCLPPRRGRFGNLHATERRTVKRASSLKPTIIPTEVRYCLLTMFEYAVTSRFWRATGHGPPQSYLLLHQQWIKMCLCALAVTGWPSTVDKFCKSVRSLACGHTAAIMPTVERCVTRRYVLTFGFWDVQHKYSLTG